MALDILLKILQLEKKKGYADSAVAGGLDRFLANQVRQPDGLPPQLRKKLAGFSYAALDRKQRQEWVDGLLEKLSPTANEKVAPPQPEKRPRPVASAPDTGLDQPITIINGVGPSVAEKLHKLGPRTVRDLLYFFPRRHLDYSQVKTIAQLVAGQEQTIIANVWESGVKRLGVRQGTEVVLGDETGNVRAIWFNQPYLAKRFRTNSRVVLSGKVSSFRGWPVFESPEWELLEDKDLVHTGRLVPVYPLTEGLYARSVRKIMKTVVDQWAARLADFLPEAIRERCGLEVLPEAIAQAHFPENEGAIDRARIRLAFDELFLLQLGVMARKQAWQMSQPGVPMNTDAPILERFLKCLPFALTAAQEKVLKELLEDVQKTQAMSRLLQGDVGSGKTVVATALLLLGAGNGCQTALMAPTEILAEQHFLTICGMLSRMAPAEEETDNCRIFPGLLEHPLKVALLLGDLTQARKRDVQAQLAAGEIDIAIGTHALIQKGIEFKNLGLVVVDEQHRFGVEQRSALRQKGFNPHMLVMTATPIPRTLALTLYGDLDLSVIDQLPPGRQAVKTRWLEPGDRERAFAFIRRQVAGGRQAFIICPLIEESDAVAAQAAVAEYEQLSTKVFPDLKLGLLHGRMASKDKDDIMARFRSGELQVLVSTPVIEVGIDVPNATVMLIESADRFGLSQLHQFRGRVGRGSEQSYCLLLAENPSEVGRARLDIIEKVQDGFILAEEDLKLRGPGEFFGTRQSGLPDLRMARLGDVKLLEMARAEAIRLFEKDPHLRQAEHRPLAKELGRVWQSQAEWS